MEPLRPRRDARALGMKRKTSEQDRDSAESPNKDCTCRSLLLASLKRYLVSPVLCAEEIHKFVLLKNTIKHLKENDVPPLSWGNPEEVPQPLLETGQPSRDTRKNLLLGCSASGSVASLVDPEEELQCAVDNLKMFGMDNSTGAPSAFLIPGQGVGKEIGDAGLADLLLDSFFPTAGESLYGESFQQDPSTASSLGVADPRSSAGNAPGSSSEEAAANPWPDSNAWDAFFQGELLCDAMSGSFEVFTSNYLSNLPSDDLFADIDTSEFESVPHALPSDGQPSPVCTNLAVCETPQAETLHFSSQNARGSGDLDHSGGLLLSF